jgi:hypothetical protein
MVVRKFKAPRKGPSQPGGSTPTTHTPAAARPLANRAPTSGEMASNDDHVPRAFRHGVLGAMRAAKAKAEAAAATGTGQGQGGKGGKSTSKGGIPTTTQRHSVYAEHVKTTKRRAKSVAYQERRREQKRSKRHPTSPEDEAEEAAARPQSLRFGDVAQEPPKLTVTPKDRVAVRKAMLQQFRSALMQGTPEGTPEGDVQQSPPPLPARGKPLLSDDIITAGRKRKLKDLSAAERRSVLEERERAITHYRTMKQARSAAGP